MKCNTQVYMLHIHECCYKYEVIDKYKEEIKGLSSINFVIYL